MIYAGVGSRQTPQEILSLMSAIGTKMAARGHFLRSGGAPGADSAFEFGCDQASGLKEIYRPYHTTAAAIELASTFHPAWERCNDYARKLHGRNMFQVLGLGLNEPADLLICWTPGGVPKGGTATALRCAAENGVIIINLFFDAHRQYIAEKLLSL